MKYYYIGAEWCCQCKVFKPQFIEKCENKSLDYECIDAESAQAAEWGIRSIPSIVIVEDGHVIRTGRAIDILKEI